MLYLKSPKNSQQNFLHRNKFNIKLFNNKIIFIIFILRKNNILKIN